MHIRPETRYRWCRYILTSSSSSGCGNCGKPVKTLAMTAFVPLDKLWVNGPDHPHPCGENPIPLYIRVLSVQFLPGYTAYSAYFSSERTVFGVSKECTHHYPPKIPTNPQAVDKVPCGWAKPGRIRLFLRSGKVIQGFSTWFDHFFVQDAWVYRGE